MTFEKIAKIFIGYIELINLIPNCENIKIEKIKTGEKYIAMVISNTSTIFKIRKNFTDPVVPETRKISFSIEIYRHENITKEGEKPE